MGMIRPAKIDIDICELNHEVIIMLARTNSPSNAPQFSTRKIGPPSPEIGMDSLHKQEYP
jgi:hypothetical protein